MGSSYRLTKSINLDVKSSIFNLRLFSLPVDWCQASSAMVVLWDFQLYAHGQNQRQKLSETEEFKIIREWKFREINVFIFTFTPNAEMTDIKNCQIRWKCQNDCFPVVTTKWRFFSIFIGNLHSIRWWFLTSSNPKFGIYLKINFSDSPNFLVIIASYLVQPHHSWSLVSTKFEHQR